MIITLVGLIPHLTFNIEQQINHYRDDRNYVVLINYKTSSGGYEPIDFIDKTKIIKKNDEYFIRIKVPIKYYKLNKQEKLYYKLIF